MAAGSDAAFQGAGSVLKGAILSFNFAVDLFAAEQGVWCQSKILRVAQSDPSRDF